MIFIGAAFSALLQTLSLTQGSFKPDPNVLAVAGNQSSNAPSVPPVAAESNGLSKGHMLFDNSDGPSTPQEFKGCYVEPYVSPPLGNPTFAPFDPAMSNLYRYRQQQSVNLGSWFVHESWMTPSLFKCAGGKKLSELDIASGWGSLASAQSVLERHWDTWINETDFKYLASIGINTVRIPVGYWNLGPYYCQDTPFQAVAQVYQNSWPRIVRAINMAADAQIGVLIDLHGAIGSQNGQPHSGISDGGINMFSNPLNMDKTINVLMFLMQQLSSVTNVVGIQILNEPKNLPELEDFYTRAITSMRQAPTPAALAFPLYLHNGFDLQRFTKYIAGRTDFVVQDHHSYFVFTPSDEAEPASQHTSDIQGHISDTLAKASDKQHRNIVVDEWSCALTSQSIANEPDKDQARRNFCEGQMDVYSSITAGWSFWSYMKEGCDGDPGWCFKAAVGNSLPATFFSYDQGPVTDPGQAQALSASISNMNVPPTSEILAKPHINDADEPQPSPRRRTRRSVGLRSSVPSFHHRFEAIHQHRWSRDPSGGSDLTSAQRSTIKGYSDGFLAAKLFALLHGSKLGFIGQYILDSIARLGPSIIAPGTEQSYHRSFIQGLTDGQAIVATILHPSQ